MRKLLWAGVLWLGCAPQVVDAVGVPSEGNAGQSAGGGSGANFGGGGGSGGQDCATACCSSPNADRDEDGTPDCEDGCPDQPDKLEPGVCGCDIPDEDRPDVAGCLGLMRTLVHRYAFEGTGDVARDTAGLVEGAAVDPDAAAADARVNNASLTGAGFLRLAGGMNGDPEDDQYVSLPAGLLSGLESATLEAWLIWYGGREWQRIFDFGNNDSETAGLQGSVGTSYLFLTANSSNALGNPPRVAYKRADYSDEIRVDSARLLPRGTEVHVAVTFDLPTGTLSLYLDGALEGSQSGVDAATGVPLRLNRIDDTYSWLGRSQFGADAELSASLDEFRIYGVALSAAQLRTSAAAGPNPVFFPNE